MARSWFARPARRSTLAASPSQWSESSFEGLRWERAQGAGRRWAVAGAIVGLLVALVLFAPAAWLASLVARGSNGHVLLADATGTVWRGSAVAVLTGGPGSRDARALPGRLQWSLRPSLLGVTVGLRHACCINGEALLKVRPGFGTVTAELQSVGGGVGQWPTALLTGLGTPWNTLQLGGLLRLNTPGLTLRWIQGRLQVQGSASFEVLEASSPIVTLDRLGSYRFSIFGDPNNAGTARLELQTLDGALQLTGDGSLGAGGLRFRGEARAAPDQEAALNNLLNIIGRRDGARSVIAIG